MTEKYQYRPRYSLSSVIDLAWVPCIPLHATNNIFVSVSWSTIVRNNQITDVCDAESK